MLEAKRVGHHPETVTAVSRDCTHVKPSANEGYNSVGKMNRPQQSIGVSVRKAIRLSGVSRSLICILCLHSTEDKNRMAPSVCFNYEN